MQNKIDKKAKKCYNIERVNDFLIESLDLKEQEEIDYIDYIEHLREVSEE